MSFEYVVIHISARANSEGSSSSRSRLGWNLLIILYWIMFFVALGLAVAFVIIMYRISDVDYSHEEPEKYCLPLLYEMYKWTMALFCLELFPTLVAYGYLKIPKRNTTASVLINEDEDGLTPDRQETDNIA